MNDIKELRSFLIIRFIRIIIVTAFVEAVILWVIEHTVFEGLLRFFFGTSDVSEIGAARIVIALITMLAGAIAGVIESILPRQITDSANVAAAMLNRLTSWAFKLPSEAGQISDLSWWYRLLLWWVLLAVLVVMLIPVAVAAIVYSRTVMAKFKRIEEADLEKQRSYEHKRNLMLSDIAHDLRTPMTTVSGYAKALQDGLVADERRREIYDALQTKTARMNELIGLLFEYVKLDSEGFALNPEDTDICELVRECAAYQYTDIEDAGMELDIDIPETPIVVKADRLELSRVVNNLIINAIRHNEAGTSIGVKLTYDGAEVMIMICDNGAPIESARAKALFEPFVTGDDARSSKGGSGLGLSIARKITDMHGFALRLTQQPDIVRFHAASGYVKMFSITIPDVKIVRVS